VSYELDTITENCYPETSVLINKLDIRDETILNEAEAITVATKSALWENDPLENAFDFKHYKAIHQYLFEDLYEWAGQPRVINISKKGTLFCAFENIEAQAELIFSRLKDRDMFVNLKRSEFVKEIVDFYCVTNFLHPFRDGNGRAQRIFITQLIHNAGYSFDFADADGDLLMIATIHSAHGVTDLLIELFDELVK